MTESRMGDGHLDLRYYLRALRRRWLLLVIGLAVGLGAAMWGVTLQDRVYESSAKVFVGPRGVGDAAQTHTFFREVVPSYVELVKSRPLLQRAVNEAQFYEVTVEQAASKVRADLVRGTRIIRVTVRDGSPQRAATLGDAVVAAFIAEVAAMSDEHVAGVATVLEPATVPSSPASPNPVRWALIGSMFGLMVGVGIAFAAETLDRSLRSREDVEEALRPLEVLAVVPDIERSVEAEHGAEAFRVLRANLQYLGQQSGLRTLVVTSPGPGEGKSTVARNLAVAFALSGKRTLLVDADLRAPTVHDTFGMQRTPGLSDVLTGRVELPQTFRPGARNLDVVPAGRPTSNPADLLGGVTMSRVLSETAGYDMVVVDSPPALGLADAVSLATGADGVLLVVRANHTPRPAAQQARRTLERLGARLMGVVLNAGSSEDEGYGYYGVYSAYLRDGEAATRSGILSRLRLRR